MTAMAWRWGLLALALIALGCQNSPPQSQAQAPDDAGGETVTWPAEGDILQSVLDQAESLNLCDGFLQPAVAEADSQVYILGDRALVELACDRAAYQMAYAYVAVLPDGGLQPLTLDGFYPDDGGNFQRVSEPTVGGLADFDPNQGLLTIFSKARGLGDCGSLATYRWTGQGLELDTYRYQECSDNPPEGDSALDPANYPQIYP